MSFTAALTDPDVGPWCKLVCALLAFSNVAVAQEAPHYRPPAEADCPQDMVDAHVREQIATYGPRSKDREYFGYIFFFEGAIDSAVIQGPSCPDPRSCSINTEKAATLIPKGAKVLGEWHTHPRLSGAGTLSDEDIRGARNNRRVRCYAAYYSPPDGNIYSWNLLQPSVHAAMASRVLIGSQDGVEPDSAAIIAAQENPGIQCLSTNTNVHTAALTKKCCRTSMTSHSRSVRAAERRGSKSSCPPPSSG